MEQINEINISEAVIHILDNNSEEPVLNEYRLELGEETYNFLLRHVERCIKDEELKYAMFCGEDNGVKKAASEFLEGHASFLDTSKEMARMLFNLMKEDASIPSSDLAVVSFTTEYGPMLGIVKMDYVKNYTHSINFIEDKIGINIVPELTGLPASAGRIQKCAFIKPYDADSSYELLMIDRQPRAKENVSYFKDKYLNCSIIENNRDKTKKLMNTIEEWTRTNLGDNASEAEKVRRTIKDKLIKEEKVDIRDLTCEIAGDDAVKERSLTEYAASQGLEDSVEIDKEWAAKKLKRIRLKIDKDIDLYINNDAYNDESKFQIQRNGDGSINMIIKHVMNYIEK